MGSGTSVSGGGRSRGACSSSAVEQRICVASSSLPSRAVELRIGDVLQANPQVEAHRKRVLVAERCGIDLEEETRRVGLEGAIGCVEQRVGVAPALEAANRNPGQVIPVVGTVDVDLVQ